MATQYRRPYVDTSVYLAAINDEIDRAPIAREIFEAAGRGDIAIVASTFVAAEIIRPRWEPAPLPEDCRWSRKVHRDGHEKCSGLGGQPTIAPPPLSFCWST